VLGILFVVALGYVTHENIRPQYRAISLIRVDPAENDLFGVKTRSDSLEPFLQTQVQLITSPNVLTAAGTNPKAAVLSRVQTSGDVVQELRKAIQVSVIPGTYLIEVSMTSDEAYEAATLVNAVVESFMESNVEWSDGMTRNQIKNLETYLGDLRNQTGEMERRWKELAAQGDPDAQVIKEVQQRANAVNPEGRSAKEGQTVNAGTITIEEYKRIKQELLQVELDMVKARARLDALRARETKDPKKIEELETEIEAGKNLERDLNTRLASLAVSSSHQATNGVEISLILDQRGNLREMQEAVNRRLEQLKFEAKGEARIRPVNAAVPPGKPISDYRMTVLRAAPFAAFVAAFVLLAIVEAFSGPPAEVREVEWPAEV
jgi:uncharacterized protein involved in exopolysaccharide biosynthesis